MVHGVTKNADLNPDLLRRDIRPFGVRLRLTFQKFGGVFTAFTGLLLAFISFSEYAAVVDIMLAIGFMLLMYSKKNVRVYPLRRPWNPNEFKVVKKKGKKKNVPLGDGILLIGNDLENDESVWISNNDARTHMLVFGSTGSGKTRFLLSMFYQALVLGSGVMYVDGKGDTTVFALVYSMVRRLGREDDLMVINYLTGSKGQGDVNDGSRLSNTTNPFSYGPSATLRSLVVSLMRDGGGDDMWKGRASALLGALLDALVYLRDSGELILDVGLIRDYMPLDRIIELVQRTDLPERATILLKKYLLDLPGYNEGDARAGDINPKCYEQHGYLQMQLTEVLQELSSTYAHIFNAPLGEIDYKDLVYNRRILFVMLPALEKDPDALSALGKLVVAGVRSALAPALGEKVEGSHEEVMLAKPTNSNVPFMLIMDEYGYYSVKGFSVVAAQARSLGVSVIFAGQDFASFKKGGEDEAKSVTANTNIKIFMKLEDVQETLDIAIKRGGKSEVATSSGYEVKGQLMSGYKDNMQTRTESRDVIDPKDLFDQENGEAHVLFGKKLFRVRLYFTEPEESPEYRINRMLMVKPPANALVDKLKNSRRNLTNMFADHESTSARSRSVDLDSGLKALFTAYEIATMRKQEPEMAAKLAFGMMEHKERLLDDEFVIALKGEPVKAEPVKIDTPHEAPNSDGDEASEYSHDISSSEHDHEWDKKAEEYTSDRSSYDQDMDVESSLGFLNEISEYDFDDSLKDESANIFTSLSDLITRQINETLDHPDTSLSPAQKELAQPISQLMSLEIEAGRDEEEAFAEARRGLEIIDETIQYPADPQPKKLSEEAIGRTLEQMLRKIERSKQE